MKYDFSYVSPELRSIIEPAALAPHYFQSELSYKVYDNSYVAPFLSWGESVGGALDSHGNDIDNCLSECLTNGRCYDIRKAETEHKTVIFLGYLISVYGHAYIDNLRSLWFLDTVECRKLLEEGAELVYVAENNKPFSDLYVKIFQMAGFDIQKARLVDHLVKFDRVIIPDSSIISSKYGRLYCDAYTKTLDRIKSYISKIDGNPVYEKIYFTRSKFPMKRESGEESIEKYFRRAGYEIISPEQYPLDAQLQMVSSCSCFAATEGSIAHISLFCKHGTKVTIINKANYLNIHQVMINEVAGLDVTYVQAHISSMTNKEYQWLGPFYLYPTRYLKKYFGFTLPCLPYWLRTDYMRYYFGNNPKTRLLKKIYRSLS